MVTRGPSVVTRGPSVVTRGPSVVTRGPSVVTRGHPWSLVVHSCVLLEHIYEKLTENVEQRGMLKAEQTSGGTT